MILYFMINNEENINKKTKKNKFQNERNEILNKLKNIINITNDNNKIFYCDINNDDIKNQILELKDDIFKYYSITSSAFYNSEKNNNNKKSNPLSVIRPIFKQHNYEILSKDVTATRNNIRKRYIQWIFNQY